MKAYLPSAREEIELIRQYGSDVLAVTLYNQTLEPDIISDHARQLEDALHVPVINPLENGVDELYGVIHEHVHSNN